MSSTRSAPRLFRARWVVLHGGEVLEDAGLLVERGRIARVLRNAGAVRRAARVLPAPACDLGPSALAPGFVDAHAHLDLGGARGRAPRGRDFLAWVRAVMRVRAARTGAEVARDARQGADELLAGGTTLAGDICGVPGLARALRAHPLRLVLFREVLDGAQRARSRSAWSAALAGARPTRAAGAGGPAGTAGTAGARRWPGLAPHAPHTVSPELLAQLGDLARRRRLRLSIHWSETRAELDWLEHARGPFAALLHDAPRRTGLDLLEQAGLLGPRTLLVHGNLARAAERERIARAGAALAHCPGTHAHFARERFDIGAWQRSGVVLALGTDSLASNDALDMRREMALLRGAHPELSPASVFDLATRGGARALGFAGLAGELRPGAWADLVQHDLAVGSARELLDALSSGRGRVAAVWIAGRRCSGGDPGGKGVLRLDFEARGTQ